MRTPKSDDLKIKLMLDSGVFSAWSKGESLSLKDYIKYLKKHQHLLASYVVMDVIPGKFGRERTQAEVAESAKGSYDNLQRMKDAGLRPIPVFHQGESWDWLVKMLHDGEDYIGISSAKDLWASRQSDWLDQVFTMLTDKSGRPLVRTHGFGITNPQLLFRYPFYTSDSTTWSLTPGFGQIMIPDQRPGGGNPNYNKPPTRVVLSGVSHTMGGSQKRQFEGWTWYPESLYEAWVKWFIENEVKATVSEARYQGNIRRKAVLIYYLRLMECLHDVRFLNRHAGFLTKKYDLPKLKPVSFERIQVMFATRWLKEWSRLMTEAGANTRLLSYYETMQLPDGHLEHYIETGLTRRSESRRKNTAPKWRSRKLTKEEKEELIAKSLKPNANSSILAKEAGVHSSTLNGWRRKHRPSAHILLKWRREGHLNLRRAALLKRGSSQGEAE